MLRRKITHWKLRTADKVIRFCLDRRIENTQLLNAFFLLYTLLLRGTYDVAYSKANHHYIPQFLLRKFKISGTGNIYQYTYGTVPKAVSIKKEAANVEDLYTFTDKATKLPNDFLEKQLFAFSVEKYASRIINTVLAEEDKPLTFLEQSILTSYVSTQYTRTPKFITLVEQVLIFLIKDKGIDIKDLMRPLFYRQAFIENKYGITPQQLGSCGLSNPLNIQGAKDLTLKIIVGIGSDIAETIYRQRMGVVGAIDPAFFYLTGGGVGIYNLKKKRSVGPFLWELNSDCLIYLPLSPTQCLYFIPQGYSLTPGEIGVLIQIATEEDISEFVYSDRLSRELEERFII